MTAIVGLVANGDVYMGADSAGVGGYFIEARADRKLFRNGEFLIGFTTSFRMGQLLRWSFEPPEHHADVDIERYMSTTFVDAIRTCLKDGGYAKKDNEVETAGGFLVGYRGHLFDIGDDYGVGQPVSGYTAVGSGMEVAMGSLFSTSADWSPMDPGQRVLVALQAAYAHNAGVRPPFIVEYISGPDQQPERQPVPSRSGTPDPEPRQAPTQARDQGRRPGRTPT